MKRMTGQRLQPLTLQFTVVQTAGPERSAEFASCGRSGVLLARSHVVQAVWGTSGCTSLAVVGIVPT